MHRVYKRPGLALPGNPGRLPGRQPARQDGWARHAGSGPSGSQAARQPGRTAHIMASRVAYLSVAQWHHAGSQLCPVHRPCIGRLAGAMRCVQTRRPPHRAPGDVSSDRATTPPAGGRPVDPRHAPAVPGGPPPIGGPHQQTTTPKRECIGTRYIHSCAHQGPDTRQAGHSCRSMGPASTSGRWCGSGRWSSRPPEPPNLVPPLPSASGWLSPSDAGAPPGNQGG